MRRVVEATAVLVAAILPIAVAAGKNPSWKGIPLDKAGLKACVDLEAGMRSKIASYNAEVKASNARIEQGKALSNELDALRAAVQDGKAEMTEYNAKVDSYNAFVNETADRKVVLSQIAVDHDAIVSEFNTKCAGRPFRNADLVNVKKHR